MEDRAALRRDRGDERHGVGPGAEHSVLRLRIQLLGPFEVWVDGQDLSPAAWPSRKACQLLKILITHRDRAVASDELIEWLWPDLAPKSARNSLWVAISRLRRLLEPAADRGESSIILVQPG